MNDCKYTITDIISSLPLVRRVLKYRQRYWYEHFITHGLLRKRCNLDAIEVKAIYWGSLTPIKSREYVNLTLNLALIDLAILGNKLEGNLIPSLHWSRRFEYPSIYYHCGLRTFPKLRVLDAGAGLNPFQVLLAMLGHIVVSLDNDITSITKLQRIAHDLKIKLYLCLAGITQIPFKDNFFDRTICISVIEHILDYLNPQFHPGISYLILKAILCELSRVTKPGGKICITLDVDLGGRRHASPNEIKILGDLLGVKIPPLPKDALISNKVPLGTLLLIIRQF